MREYRACLETPARYPYRNHLPGTVVTEQLLNNDGFRRYHFVPDAARDHVLEVTCRECMSRTCSHIYPHAAASVVAMVSNRRIR